MITNIILAALGFAVFIMASVLLQVIRRLEDIEKQIRAAEQRDEADGELAGKAPKSLSTKDK